MACGNCGSGTGDKPAGCGSNGSCSSGSCGKLTVFDWLSGMNLPDRDSGPVEVQFKNTRKGYYYNPDKVHVYKGQTVVVESGTGYDIGVVSLTGELVKVQMQKKNARSDRNEIQKILRLPNQEELDKWQEGREKEENVKTKARSIANSLNLRMKISDVEFQADHKKATFYYTADNRVDFRELIRRFADEFKLRVEMRQIGARQEAGRLGGIGSCGRELCCSTWLTDFRSVSTSAARYQQLSINPSKLAGQCGKLKCCLNYELDSYLDALKDFPDKNKKLKTQKGIAFHQKSDIFQGRMWYSYPDDPSKFYCLTTDRVNEILKLNSDGKKPDELSSYQIDLSPTEESKTYENVVGQDSLTRFDNTKKSKRKGRGSRNKPGNNRKGGSHQMKKGGSRKGSSQRNKRNKGHNKPTNKKREQHQKK